MCVKICICIYDYTYIKIFMSQNLNTYFMTVLLTLLKISKYNLSKMDNVWVNNYTAWIQNKVSQSK